jgi:hypothetical protein
MPWFTFDIRLSLALSELKGAGHYLPHAAILDAANAPGTVKNLQFIEK